MTRRARKDGREARRNEEREKREDENGAIVSSRQVGVQASKFVKCHGVKQNAKICAIGEQNVVN